MLKGIVSGEEKDIIRIPMLVGNEYKEGWEVRDNQDRLIWGREDEFQTNTGTLPFKGYGLPVKVKSLLGNAVQNGTPSPDNVIMPTFCGVRTGNLWYESYPNISGTIRYIPLYVGEGSFTLSTTTPYDSGVANLFLLGGNVSTGASTQGNGAWFKHNVTVQSESGYVTIAYRHYTGTTSPADRNTMLNTGSTALPYEPFGYKIPLTCAGQTTPVYLGEVPTVRRVKKLVLTGEETGWSQNTSGTNTFRGALTLQYENMTGAGGFCSHNIYKISGISADEEGCSCYRGALYFRISRTIASDIASFKQWLSQQYAAGNPVTVWYVLSTPTTGIVNEPLAKIGDYADELTTIKVNGLSAPLYGIGDYKDILNLSTGVITRKVKKLVFDGSENWGLASTDNNRTVCVFSLSGEYVVGYCTHINWKGTYEEQDYNRIVFNNYSGGSLYVSLENSVLSGQTAYDFKSFLRQQYQNGTPVTVWYVLSTPETETVSVPTGMTGEIEGYLTQISTPTPEHPSIPKWNGEEETGGTYAVAVYTPPKIPTTTGQNTLTVDTTLAPSSLTIKGHIKESQPENLLPVSKFEDLSDPSWWSGGYYIRYNNMPAGTYVMSTNMPEKDPGDVYFNGENALNVPYEGRPVSQTISEGGSFYVLFFVDRGGYESILNGTFVITLIKSE